MKPGDLVIITEDNMPFLVGEVAEFLGIDTERDNFPFTVRLLRGYTSLLSINTVIGVINVAPATDLIKALS